MIKKKKKFIFKYLKKILSSKVIEEYFYKLKSSQTYEFPFNNKKLIKFLWDKLIFADIDDCWGMTNKEGFAIFINRKKGNPSNGLGYGICIITICHEIVSHSLNNLINSNEGELAGTSTPIRNFIKNSDNNKTNNLGDSGDKFEFILFGERVSKLTIGGTHYLFNINNWNSSIKQFIKGFRCNNELKEVKVLKNELNNLMNNDLDVKVLFSNVKYDQIGYNIKSQSMTARKASERFSNENFIS